MKEIEIRSGLPKGEGLTGIVIGDGGFIVRPHLFSEFESLVEDESTATDSFPKDDGLVLLRIESEFIGFLNHGSSTSYLKPGSLSSPP